jgi:hypothetical protein
LVVILWWGLIKPCQPVDEDDMGAWIGLVGVVAGAFVALVSQYLIRNSEARERRETLLLEQLAMVIALSEDYRDRVWQERNKVSTGVVAAWDIGPYRVGEAKLKILCQDSNLLAALMALNRCGIELGTSWELSPEDEGRTEAAWKAHKTALEQFIAVSSTMFRGQRVRKGRSSVLAIPPIGAP